MSSPNFQKVVASERGVLICALNDNSLIDRCALKSDDFFDWRARACWEAVIESMATHGRCDAATIIELVEFADAYAWLCEIAKEAAQTLGDAYADVVARESRRRKAYAIAQQAIEALSTSDYGEAVDVAVRDMLALSRDAGNHECGIKQALKIAIDDIDDACKSGGKLRGLTSGLADLDECLGGFHAGDLVVIGARPAIGKTAFMLNICTAPTESVGVISSEQGRGQIGARWLAMHGKVSLHSMRTGRVDPAQLDRVTSAAVRLSGQAMVRVNDKPGISIDEVIRQARSWKFEHDIKALYIDYIQRIHPRDKKIPRHEQVADIVQSLKELARELEISVIALGQVSRKVDERSDKRPHMGDLAESGCIEREADQIMLLYRDEAYNEQSDRKGILDILVEKNRHGPTGLVAAAWIGEFVKVGNLGERNDF